MKISASSAQAMLDVVVPTNAVEAARHDLALEHLADLRRLDEQMAASRRRIKAAVKAAQTSVTEIFGVGPIVAAMVIGYSGDIRRLAPTTATPPTPAPLPSRCPPAAGSCTGSRRGCRQLNHAVHIAAITQIRHPHSEGRAFYDRKVAEGKTKKEAVRALKRRISDAVYRRLLEDQTGR